MPTVTVSQSASVDGGSNQQATYNVSVGQAIVINETVPAPSTDLQILVSIDVSQIKTLFLLSPDADMTLETNSGSSPAETITLKAGKPLVWESNSGEPNPFGATDVTSIYATVGGATATSLRAVIGLDPTA